jgi:hypothetical protein
MKLVTNTFAAVLVIFIFILVLVRALRSVTSVQYSGFLKLTICRLSNRHTSVRIIRDNNFTVMLQDTCISQRQ